MSLRSNSKVPSVAHARQHCENFVGADADSPVTMESQSRSKSHASLQVDFKVLSGARASLQVDFKVFCGVRASLQVDFKVLCGAHASLQVDFEVLSGAHVSLRSTSKFDPGSAEPQTDINGRNERLAHRQIQARIQLDYILRLGRG